MAMDMRGSLNLSKFFKPGSNQPKYYGKAMINGVECTLKGWEKIGKDGSPWISLLFESLEGDGGFEQCAPKKTGLFSTPDEPAAIKRTPISSQPSWKYDDDIPF